MNTYKRTVISGLASLLLTGGLVGCSMLPLGPRSIHVSEAKLAAMIGDQFPFNSRYLELFDVVLERPQVRLMPAENRIGTAMAYRIDASLLGMRPTQGRLDLSYSLRFEPADQTVRLTQVRVERFDVPGVAPSIAPRVNRLGGFLAEALLKDFVIHRLKPEDLRTAQGWGYQPGALEVVPGGLRLQLDPVQRR
ncbi:MAG: hypothetical protein Q7J58_20595 [Hydrogenophaga sp.]|jgi:hypothetical protein|uniref:hypothetical protein n=1 Tax=Hydrogenophaga sp. TaxID=1904254 RepID=UPI0027161429|nr:hypothetical protein [Hydrogenophaga sp.]MDO9571756.1 hypothetical protein [Hydrogenophaga sp.]MDP3375927.1 hypothetical protein [Hydrogenophaga sp.]